MYEWVQLFFVHGNAEQHAKSYGEANHWHREVNKLDERTSL